MQGGWSTGRALTPRPLSQRERGTRISARDSFSPLSLWQRGRGVRGVGLRDRRPVDPAAGPAGPPYDSTSPAWPKASFTIFRGIAGIARSLGVGVGGAVEAGSRAVRSVSPGRFCVGDF